MPEEKKKTEAEYATHAVQHNAPGLLLRLRQSLHTSVKEIRLRVWLTFALVSGLSIAAVAIPLPYVITSPGPTVDVVGMWSGKPVIDITGTHSDTHQPLTLDAPHTAEQATGELRLVTVSEMGGPGYSVNALTLLVKWLEGGNTIQRYSDVYGPQVTHEQIEQFGKAQMKSAQSTSSVAALEELGWSVPATVTVEGTVEGSGAQEVLHEKDILRTIITPDGVRHEVNSASVPFRLMRHVPAGSLVTLEVERGGVLTSVEVQTTASEGIDEGEGSKIGVYLSADVMMPVDIHIDLENITGPSAGMMFALGIIDRMTPGDITGGQKIAGTGTVSYDGQIGPIGGIQQKMRGAVRDGAMWFLAPQMNCSEVIGHIPEGLHVFSVSTLSEAKAAVEAIASGRTQQLPTCQAP
ncbi:YlbL family protein [Schaalia sp. lx-260]|uniref:YlbL family protein n=1 Tax=Schaalia sp. lx-260 TaxID=2899082 RepID=UPI001E2DFC54|nr:peptidase S16 [Schaalia sp. lx-260]